MLKLIESYSINGLTAEIFQTAHSGSDYHVRYGLDIRHFETLEGARADFGYCINHARECETGTVPLLARWAG